jgi:putative transposase
VPNHPFHRAYDHRIRDLVCEERDPALFAQLGIPRSTAASWIRRGSRPVVTTELFAEDEQQLRARVLKLERRVQLLLGITRLLLLLVRLFGFRLDSQRVPSGEAKSSILGAIERAKQRVPVTVALRVLGLSASRYQSWLRLEQSCSLDDRSSCPRTVPSQLTHQEIATVHDMATAMEFRHMPIRVLALYAQRIGRVFAAPATWARLIRERGWRRPRQRVYPAKPKTGIRASRPNEVWHIDMSVIRLLDGTRTYLHAIIDNFSRRILAWKLAEKLSPLTTCELLQDAAQYLGADDDPPELYADSGVENVNEDVDALINEGLIHRVLAQVEVAFSNSLIEAWWRSLKSNWLHLNTLDTVAAVRRLTSFYVAEHNTKMPHAAFHGQTPDEVYFGRGDDVADQLAEAKRHARQTRLATNRNLSCDACRTEPAPLSPSESVASGEGEPQ